MQTKKIPDTDKEPGNLSFLNIDFNPSSLRTEAPDNPTEEFRQAMRNEGIEPPDVINADKIIHRFGKDKDCWYIFHLDGTPNGQFGDWSRDQGDTAFSYCSKPNLAMTPEEREAIRKQAEQNRKARETEQEANRAVAKKKVSILIERSTPAREDHPYLAGKGIHPVSSLYETTAEGAYSALEYRPKVKDVRLSGRILMTVPIWDNTGEVVTCELIDESGRKAVICGKKGGGFWWPESPTAKDQHILIAEGVATAISAKEATGLPVVAALSSGNLKAVAQLISQRFSGVSLVILADLKKGTQKPCPKAQEAAEAVNGLLAIPSTAGTDFNDQHVEHGLESVKASILAATKPEKKGPRVSLLNGADIEPESIDWLWHEFIAKGKLHVLAGPPGTGKTTIALALAATLTRGSRWPDGTDAPIGNVLVWSGEDDPKDTLAPRLIAMGANRKRVYFVGDVHESGSITTFDPALHIAALQEAAEQIGGVSMLIVDPIVSAVAGDSHKNTEVRRGLRPLVTLGETLGCAVFGITHFSKGAAGRDPLERVTGSIAFGAVARLVYGAAKMPMHDQVGGARIVIRAKSNIGPDGDGFRYDLGQVELPAYPGVFASELQWGNKEEGSARDLFARADSVKSEEAPEEDTPEFNEAGEWLMEFLAYGPKTATEIFKAAKNNGFTKDQIKRAKPKLGITSGKVGYQSEWVWMMPEGTYSKGAEDLQREQIFPNKKTVLPLRPLTEPAPAVASSDCSLCNDDAPLLPLSEPSNDGASSDFLPSKGSKGSR